MGVRVRVRVRVRGLGCLELVREGEGLDVVAAVLDGEEGQRDRAPLG